MTQKRLNGGVAIGYVLGALFYAICLGMAFVIDTWWLNVAICLFGFAFGWNVGMLLSPKNRKEKRTFARLGKAITAFLGGFLLAKLDALFVGAELQKMVSNPVIDARLLMFGTTFFFGVQCTYIGRYYQLWLDVPKAVTAPAALRADTPPSA